MPSARPSKFSGGGGLLRKVDATIVGLELVTQTSKPKPPVPASNGKPAQPAKAAFESVQAVLTVLPDGATEPVKTFGLFIGGTADYKIESPTSVSGTKEFNQKRGFPLLLKTLVDSKCPEDIFPEDPEGLVAEFKGVIGARVRFDWQVNEEATKTFGRTFSKKDPERKGKGFDREDLIITAYYGHADVAPGGKTTGKVSAKATKAAAAAAVDIPTLATEKTIEAVSKAKDKKLTKTRLGVKLLNLLSAVDSDTRNAAIAWTTSDDNLASIDDLDYNVTTQTLSVPVETAEDEDDE